MTVFVIISFVIDDFSVQKNGKKTPPLQEVTRQKIILNTALLEYGVRQKWNEKKRSLSLIKTFKKLRKT